MLRREAEASDPEDGQRSHAGWVQADRAPASVTWMRTQGSSPRSLNSALSSGMPCSMLFGAGLLLLSAAYVSLRGPCPLDQLAAAVIASASPWTPPPPDTPG